MWQRLRTVVLNEVTGGIIVLLVTVSFAVLMFAGSSETVEAAGTFVTATTALMIVYLTNRNVRIASAQVRESSRLRLAQSAPDVVAYLEADPRWNGAIDFVLRNTGYGTAYQVKFPNLPHRVIDPTGDGQAQFSLDELPLFRGIDFLAPGQEYRFYFMQLVVDPDNEELPLFLMMTYHSQETRETDAPPITRSFVLDPRLFIHLFRVGEPPSYSMAKSLRRVAKNTEALPKLARRLNSPAQERESPFAWVQRWRERRRRARMEQIVEEMRSRNWDSEVLF